MSSVPAPYEVPSKTEMRFRCEVAIDQAGHQLEAKPQAISLPGSDIKGRVRGDLQSRDDTGDLYCYYIRSVAEDAIPQWLADYGRHVRKVPNTRLYVVYEAASADLEQSCKVAGIGLVVLTDDNRFEYIVNFDDVLPEELEEEVREQIRSVRRKFESKLDTHRKSLDSRISQVAEITANMPEEMSSNFLSNLEAEGRKLEDWSVEISRELDSLSASFDHEELSRVLDRIEAGARSPEPETS